MRGEVGAAVEPEHRDDTARDERLDDLGVGVPCDAAVPPGRQPGLVAEDRGLEAPDRLARLEAELVERRPVGVVGAERVGLAARARRARASGARRAARAADARRTSDSSSGTTSAGRPSSTSVAIRSSTATRRSSSSRRASVCAQSSKANSASAGPRQRSSASQEERAALLRRAARASASSRSKRRASTCSARHRQDVPRRPGDEDVRAERLPERDDRVLQRRGRSRRRIGAVELVDELLGRDDAPGAQEQRGQEGALSRPPEGDRPLLAPHLERAEDPELLHAGRLYHPSPTAS